MKMPDCYEAYRQEDRQQREMDLYMEKLPACCICGDKIPEGEKAHKTRGKLVCAYCMDELEEDYFFVEVD